MTIAPLLQLAPGILRQWLERRRIKSELAALDVFDTHFENKVKSGLAGQSWAKHRRMNLNLQLQDLENGRR